MLKRIFILMIAIANTNIFAGSNTINVDVRDKKMEKAFEKAKKTLDVILGRYEKRKIPEIFLKVKITDDKIVEYVWMADIRYNHGKYVGRVNNEPEDVRNIQIGQSYRFDKSEIYDWMYLKDKKMYGNFTLRATVDRIEESNFYKSILAPADKLY